MRCLFLVAAVLVGAHAQDQPCSKQMELEKRCQMNIETSPEATMIRDRKKQIMATCVPDMPKECHGQWEAAHDCAISIAKNADSDPLFTESKSKSQPAIDQCFEKYPPNVKEGFMEIFMMDKPHPPPRFRHWEHRGNDTSGEQESGESSAEGNDTSASFERRHHGGGGRGGHGGHGGRGGHGRHGRHGRHCRPHHHGRHGGHHGPRNLTSSSSESNETSSSSESGGKSGSHSGGKSGGRSGGKSWEKRIPEQCRKTEEQKQCIKAEFKKLAKDDSFINLMNTLIRQKKKCKQIVDWSCSAKCPKKQKCIFEASKPCREAFMQRMQTCMQGKGYTLPPFMRPHDAYTTPTPLIQD